MAASGALADRHILLAVTGSIAAFKAVLLLRRLKKAGAEVRVILTASGERFVGKPTFAGLGVEVYSSMWTEGETGETHVQLATWADALLVAPCTADSMARLSQGRGDDLLTATALCFSGPTCLAPAMHPSMWASQATQQNAHMLHERGFHFLGPVEGEVASGDIGLGRMEEPERILHGLGRALAGPGSLEGRHLVVTAGPTRESIDPVRALTNLSSGKMGYAIAEVAASRGAHVTLISGPVQLEVPPGVSVVQVESALQMSQALDHALGPQLDRAEALVMAAAVSDYRPEAPSGSKLKRQSEGLNLRLTPNPDLLATIGQRRTTLRPVLVGFALETETGDALIGLARRKLIEKRVDMVVANSAAESLNRDDSRAMLVSPVDCTPLEQMQKPRVAAHIVDWLEKRLLGPAVQEATE